MIDADAYSRIYDLLRDDREDQITAEDARQIRWAPAQSPIKVLSILDQGDVDSANQRDAMRAADDPRYDPAQDRDHVTRRPWIKVERTGPDARQLAFDTTGFTLNEFVTRPRG